MEAAASAPSSNADSYDGTLNDLSVDDAALLGKGRACVSYGMLLPPSTESAVRGTSPDTAEADSALAGSDTDATVAIELAMSISSSSTLGAF